MYKILKDNRIIAIVEQPRYVKRKSTTGVWIQCDKEEAEAITVNSLLYNLPGLDNVSEADTVEVVTCDWNEFILDNILQTQTLQAQVDYITMMTELDGSYEEEPAIKKKEEEDASEEIIPPAEENTFEHRDDGLEGDEEHV